MVLHRSLQTSHLASSFNDRVIAISHSELLAHRRQVGVQNPGKWVVKVIYTLFICSQSQDILTFFQHNLSPSIAYQVVQHFRSPKLSLDFFNFTRTTVQLKHIFPSYALLVRRLCHRGHLDSATDVFDMMKVDGHYPDGSILGVLVTSFAQVGKVDFVVELVHQAQAYKYKLSSYVSNTLLNYMVRSNRTAEAVRFLREQMMEHFTLDTCTFNIIIKGLCKSGNISEAFEIFHEMAIFGCHPNAITYNGLILGLFQSNQADRVCGLLQEMGSNDTSKPDFCDLYIYNIWLL
ncbi:pentatricopeptide repeat-containing protein At2g06000-like [Aristolochia californica]|uniref:pentatricopeptide repeat-containing protein At2g06000-like n=1 Tax=Aristolochia californica TaxID=171875 RepID=UPI0035DBE650